MPELKLTINSKDGKSYSKTVDNSLIGRKLGETIPGDTLGLTGYELKISGGSDSSGFPMRKEIILAGKKKIFAKSGVGINPKHKGNYLRKTVAGNTIHEKTAQINLAVLKPGKKPLNDLLGKKETKEEKEEEKEAKLEEKPKPKEEKKEEPKKEETPVEEKKEEVKEETK